MARIALSGPFISRASVQQALHKHCPLPFWGKEWEGHRTVPGGGALYASFCLGGVKIASLLKVAAQPAYLLPTPTPHPVLAACWHKRNAYSHETRR